MTDTLLEQQSAVKNPVVPEVDALLAEHIANTFGSPELRWQMSQAFSRDGYLRISNVVPPEHLANIRAEVFSLLERFAIRRDLLIEATGNTPRYLSNVRYVDVRDYGHYVPATYHSRPLMDFLGDIARDRIIPSPWEFERFIINRLEKSGDTHGWHWGDYPYSVIWVIEAPAAEYGGLLQCIPHTYWDKRNPRVNEHILNNPIRSYHHNSGDIYLLKSDTTLHRVSPLEQEATRVIINMAWEAERQKDREITHETFAFRE